MTHIHLWLWDFGSGIDRHGLKNEFIDTHFTKALCVDSWQVSNLVLHKRLQPELLFQNFYILLLLALEFSLHLPT